MVKKVLGALLVHDVEQRAARNYADVHRRNDPHGRGRHER